MLPFLENAFFHITDPQFSKDSYTVRVIPLDLWTDRQMDRAVQQF